MINQFEKTANGIAQTHHLQHYKGGKKRTENHYSIKPAVKIKRTVAKSISKKKPALAAKAKRPTKKTVKNKK